MRPPDSCRALIGAEPASRCFRSQPKAVRGHRLVDKVSKRCAQVRARAPEIEIDGECRLTPRSCPRSRNQKRPGSSVAGRANVLNLPDLHPATLPTN